MIDRNRTGNVPWLLRLDLTQPTIEYVRDLMIDYIGHRLSDPWRLSRGVATLGYYATPKEAMEAADALIFAGTGEAIS